MKFFNNKTKLLLTLIIASVSISIVLSTNLKSKNKQVEKNYDVLWKTMFISGAKRPGSLCKVPLTLGSKPVKKPVVEEERQSFLPKKKPNVFYNKPGYEDSAYFWDYLDNVLQKQIVQAFKTIWTQAKSAPPNPQTKNPYDLREQLLYYYNNGGRYKIPFDPFKEPDMTKIGNAVHSFNNNIDPAVVAGGLTIPQMEAVFKMFNISYNPGSIGWEKKKLDFYDFNGDGVLSTEEFLFMLIWENKQKLHFPNMFKQLCDTILDPMFEYFDCDADGAVTSEGIWLGLKELIRPTNECDIYVCKSAKTKNHARTTAPNDVVLKNAEEDEGYLTKVEWRKAVLLAYWDRQVNNNLIFDKDEDNQKDFRWSMGNTFDLNCMDGAGPR
jgi:hypothetical protein